MLKFNTWPPEPGKVELTQYGQQFFVNLLLPEAGRDESGDLDFIGSIGNLFAENNVEEIPAHEIALELSEYVLPGQRNRFLQYFSYGFSAMEEK